MTPYLECLAYSSGDALALLQTYVRLFDTDFPKECSKYAAGISRGSKAADSMQQPFDPSGHAHDDSDLPHLAATGLLHAELHVAKVDLDSVLNVVRHETISCVACHKAVI